MQIAETTAAEIEDELGIRSAHQSAQSSALIAAREREGEEHRQRMATHTKQLEQLKEAVTTSRRVDPRDYLQLLEPACKMLTESAKHEVELSKALGASWVTAETESARQQAARAEARLARVQADLAEEIARRKPQIAEAEAAARASAQKQVDELKDYVASLVSELQEKDASARATQQTVLDQLARERETFHSSLQRLQKELHAARKEGARGGKIASHLVNKVVVEWARRRKQRIVLGWRAEVLRSKRLDAAKREAAVAKGAERLASSSLLVALQRWRQNELQRAFVQLTAAAARARAVREGRRRRAMGEEAAGAAAAEVSKPRRAHHSSTSNHRDHRGSRHHHRSRKHHAVPLPEAATTKPVVAAAPAPQAAPSARSDAASSCVPTGHAAQPAASPPQLATLAVPSRPSGPQSETERRSQYLEYLKSCLRQQRPPAPRWSRSLTRLEAIFRTRR